MFLPTRPGVVLILESAPPLGLWITLRSGRVLAPPRGVTATSHEGPGRRRPVR